MKIIDIISETKLFEMAYERRKARELVNDQSDNIVSHLLKLFVLDSPNDTNHWISEINKWLFKIDNLTLKPNNKRISKNDLYNWLLVDNVPTYDSAYINRKIRHWKNSDYADVPLREFDEEFVLNKIFDILTKVCEDIYQDKFATIRDYL